MVQMRFEEYLEREDLKNVIDGSPGGNMRNFICWNVDAYLQIARNWDASLPLYGGEALESCKSNL